MIAVKVGDVVDGVVKVEGVAPLAPAHPRHVVCARHANRPREEVAAAECEIGGMKGPKAAPGHQDLRRPAAVAMDERHDVAHDAVLEALMLLCPQLEREVGSPPAVGLEAVDAIDLDAPGIDEVRHGPEE